MSYGHSDASETLPVGAHAAPPVQAPTPGTAIGRYLVIGTLGSGAMGMVAHAYDPKLQREVALKVLRTQALGAEAQTRLVREARAMAKLAHPNVVAVFDVDRDREQGTVVAMEYVAGRTLKQWVRAESPSPKAIVDAFVQAGRGLGAAHDAGLLHRDFKPDNVLVGEDGRVRVTDFGLARIDRGGEDPSTEGGGPRLKVAADLTAFGTVLGTPRYMAPEQHGIGELTPAADQFAFCVSLWQMLTGKLPYEAQDLETLATLKCEGPPPWPRGVAVPKAVVDAIRRGLAADPTARWPSMLALVTAISGGYARRRRNRIVLATVGAVSLVGTLAVTLWPEAPSPCAGGAERLGEAWSDTRRHAVASAIEGTGLSYAASTWGTIAPLLDAYAEEWRTQYTDACEATRVHAVQSEALLDARMACLQAARDRLASTTELLASADASLVERAGDMVGALPALSSCANAEYLRATVTPAPVEIADEVAKVRSDLARVHALVSAGKYAESAEALAPVAERARELDFGPLKTEVSLARGWTHERLGEYEASATAFSEALRYALTEGQIDEAAEASSALVMTTGSFLHQTSRAHDFAVTAWGLVPRVSRPLDREAELRRVLGSVYREEGEFDRSVEELRMALQLVQRDPESDALDVAAVRYALGNSLKVAGKLDEAETEMREVVALRERHLGAAHPRTGHAHHNLATLLALRGDLKEADAEFELALTNLVAALGEDHPTVAAVRSNRAGVLEDLGHSEEAFEEFQRALESFERSQGADHPQTAMARHNYALRLGKRGDHERAAAELRDVIAVISEKLGPEHPVVATAHINLAIELEEGGKLDEAVEIVREAERMRAKLMDDDHIELAEVRVQLARLLLESGREAEADPIAAAAWKVYARGDGTAARRGQSAFVYAKARRAAGDSAKAQSLATEAIAIFEAAADPDAAAAVRQWLAL